MSPAEIGAQVDKILASSLFSSSARLTRFLRFVVSTAADGHEHSLKEYSIGVEVFDRGADFDPRIDNIVRIHAAKLRSKLTEYYASIGGSDPIVIRIPKGAYVPEILPREGKGTRTPLPSEGRSRIAVLPFVNMSADPENEYFSDGLTEELINRLAANQGLQVVARTSVFQFKGRHQDLREVGAKLSVSTVLEGSVRRAGDQVRVTAQLIDVETGFHIFSRTWQREFKGIFELQDELAQAVAREIAPHNHVETHRANPTNQDAYTAYLRGMHALASRFMDLPRCIDCFREAISHDPGYAPAWAGMSQGYFLMAWFYRAPPEVTLPLCRDAALKALSIHPDSALGLHCLGVVECATEWNWTSAEQRFRKAIELQPTISLGYLNYAFFCLLPQLRVLEACTVIEQALSLDPFNPLIRAIAIYIYNRAGRFDDAIRQNTLARSIGPGYAPIPACMGGVQETAGLLDDAIESYREASALSGNAPYPYSCLGHALGVAGKTAEARSILSQLESSHLQPAADIARVYCGLRDTDQTLHWLELAAAQRSLYLLRTIGDTRFAWLFHHPRYRALIQGMGLPQPSQAAPVAG